MFHFISSYDLVETEVYHQKFSFTRKWEDCGGLSDCEELVRVTHSNQKLSLFILSKRTLVARQSSSLYSSILCLIF